MALNSLKIGQVARGSGVGIDAVRYYERRGLLPEPPRRESGYRAYPPGAIPRVRFIKSAQELGFSLREIQELLDLRVRDDASCADVRQTAETKIHDIDEKVKQLQSIRKILTELAAVCPGSGPTSECPIIAALEPQE